MSNFKQMFAILDLETTGGSPKTGKITEIAIYMHDGHTVTREYQTLINPEQPIPDFITRLTGINDEMVANAPKFYEVAREVVEITRNATIVAHNAAFDYGFLKHEFKQLGYNYQLPTLCTVKLSRSMLPGKRSYALGNLCKELGIEINQRHRAAGDAQATVKLFELLRTLESTAMVPGLPESAISSTHEQLINELPTECGVYFFHDKDDEIIYVGKSTRIRARVRDHFRTRGQTKKEQMIALTKRLSYEVTGSELIALLRESELIKQLQPRFNRAQRSTRMDWGMYSYITREGYQCLTVAKIKKSDPEMTPVAMFKSKAEGDQELERLTDEFDLCQKVNGLYNSSQECFQHMIGKCKGACVGKEIPDEYNTRVQAAIQTYELQLENFVLIDAGRTNKELSYAWVEDGTYKGYGYMKDTGVLDLAKMRKQLIPKQDNKDTRKILRWAIKGRNYRQLLIH